MNKKADPFEFEFQNVLTTNSVWEVNNYLAVEGRRKVEITSHFLKACCCPCVILGQLNSLIYREDSKERFEMGHQGCNICALTSVLCLLGWPFSPLLGIYTCIQRDNLQKLHKSRNPAFASKDVSTIFDSFKEKSSVCCLWPCAILEQEYHMRHLDSIGLLPFHWEYDLIHTSIPSPPISECYTIMILGSNNCGKSTLFQKMLHTSIPELHNQIENRLPDQKLRIGIRNTIVSKEQISFVEVWDIPMNDIINLPINFANHTCKHVLYNTILLDKTIVFLTFDVFSMQSWNELLQMYNLLEHAINSNKSLHVVLLMLKYDLIIDLVDQMIIDYKPIYDKLTQKEVEKEVEPDSDVALSVAFKDDMNISQKNTDAMQLEYVLANEYMQNESFQLHPLQDNLKAYYEALIWANRVKIPIFKISCHQYNYGIKDIYSYIYRITNKSGELSSVSTTFVNQRPFSA